MGNYPEYIDQAVKLINNNWSLTIIGWLLGWVTAWWSNRQLAKIQAQTIKSLTDAIVAFEDKFKDNLEPLTDPEQDKLNDARNLFVTRDSIPGDGYIFIRFLKIMLRIFVIISSPFVLLGIFVDQGFFGAIILFGAMISIVGFAIFLNSSLYEPLNIEGERLDFIRTSLKGLHLNFRQAQHLRRWASSHEFLFFRKGNVLRTIEVAFV